MFIGKQMRDELPRKRIGGLLLLAVMLGAVVWLLSGPGDGASAAGSNDAFAKATVIGSLPFTTTQNNAGYTTETSEPLPCGSKGATAWFRFTPTVDTTVTVDTGTSVYDTVLAVYTGATLTNLTNLDCKNTVTGVGTETITFNGKAGVTYQIQAGGAAGAAGSLTLNASGTAVGGIPHLINYQGRLTDSGGTPVADGGYSVAFRIYDSFTGGTQQWTETQKVAVSGGLFNVLLGSNSQIPASVFSGETRFLEVQVGADPAMTPRQRLASVPYAMRAAGLLGSSGSEFTYSSVDDTWGGSFSVRANEIRSNGHMYVNYDGPEGYFNVCFYAGGAPCGAVLQWQNDNDRFQFSNDVHVLGVVTSTSDRNAKANFGDVDERQVLDRLAEIPIESWNFKDDKAATRHIGPTAQDFSAAFGVGADDKTISTTDADGVALASIQALYADGKEKDARIDALEERLAALEGGGGASPQAAASASGEGVSWLTIVLPLLALFAIPAGGLLGGWAGRRARL